MTRADRHNAIRRHLYQHGLTGVQGLAEAVGTSLPTLRRDLQELEEQGVVDRVHGGAQIARGSTVEIDFDMREQDNLAAKRAIATAAMGLIEPHSSIFLDAGTTVLQVANLLRLDPLPLNVFTNGLKVAMALLDVPRIKLFMLGGMVRPENASLVGPQAEQQLRSLRFDTLLLGAGAITESGEICGVDDAGTGINQCMLERANRTVLLADSSKLGATATFRVASLCKGMTVVTDAGISDDWRRRIPETGASLIVAEPL